MKCIELQQAYQNSVFYSIHGWLTRGIDEVPGCWSLCRCFLHRVELLKKLFLGAPDDGFRQELPTLYAKFCWGCQKDLEGFVTAQEEELWKRLPSFLGLGNWGTLVNAGI